HDDIRVLYETTRDLRVAWIFQVKNDGLLVPVHGREILAVAAGHRRPLSEGVAARWLDLDHFSAHVGQEHGAEWSRCSGAKLDDADACEWELRARCIGGAGVWIHDPMLGAAPTADLPFHICERPGPYEQHLDQGLAPARRARA